MNDKCFRSDRGRDPIAELARLIAQADTHDESVPSDDRSREETVSNGYDEAPELPPAPQLAVDLNDDDQSCEHDEHCPDDQACGVDDDLSAAEQEYHDSEFPHDPVEEEHQDYEVLRVRRHRLTLAIAIIGLALVGSACAVGYRNTFAGSVSPTPPQSVKAINEANTIPAVSDAQASNSGPMREIGPAITGSIDSEDQPAPTGPPKAAPRTSQPRASAPTTPAADQPIPNRVAQRTAAAAPAPRLTIAADPQRPGKAGSEDDTVTTNHKNLAALPAESGAAAHVAAGGYAVQVTSERSESRAQAAFRALQAKYPNQLSGHQPIIRRADLGAAGIYYRAFVGPFASAEKATTMCSALKAAGGDCIIQKN
jgi:cell division septation protein DedD